MVYFQVNLEVRPTIDFGVSKTQPKLETVTFCFSVRCDCQAAFRRAQRQRQPVRRLRRVPQHRRRGQGEVLPRLAADKFRWRRELSRDRQSGAQRTLH